MPKHIYEDFIERLFEHRNSASKYIDKKVNSISLFRANKRPVLSEVAAGQKNINYHLVLHHIHLIKVLELQVYKAYIIAYSSFNLS